MIGAVVSGRIADYAGRRVVSHSLAALILVSMLLLLLTFGYSAFCCAGHGILPGFLHLGMACHNILKGFPLISSSSSPNLSSCALCNSGICPKTSSNHEVLVTFPKEKNA